ncbi:MAG: hypothetical protein MZV70_35010 [Desulfobacterales bacterium]|nr:hypothetical protein [Desulfobacterales bacterium]
MRTGNRPGAGGGGSVPSPPSPAELQGRVSDLHDRTGGAQGRAEGAGGQLQPHRLTLLQGYVTCGYVEGAGNRGGGVEGDVERIPGGDALEPEGLVRPLGSRHLPVAEAEGYGTGQPGQDEDAPGQFL